MIKNKINNIFRIGIASLVIYIIAIIAIIIAITISFVSINSNVNGEATVDLLLPGIASFCLFVLAITLFFVTIDSNAINGDEVTVDLFLPGIASFCLFVLAISLFIIVDILNIFICVYIGTFPIDSSSNNLYNKRSTFLICAVIFTNRIN